MYTPFTPSRQDEAEDLELIAKVFNGKRDALEQLVRRHQRWIFNIAVRMTADFDLSEDITQEILIKMITKLATYDHRKGALRTWLYRIVYNYVISLKRKDRPYVMPGSFKAFGQHLDAVPPEPLPDKEGFSSETQLLIEEAKNGCMSLILLCLPLRQRIVYILGEIFNISSSEGSAILEVSPASFRQILSRARKKLNAFIEEKCGLANPRARCHCEDKVLPNLKSGRIQPEKLRFSQPVPERVRDVVAHKVAAMNRLADDIPKLYQDHPFYQPKDSALLFKQILENPKYRPLFS